VAFSRQEKSPKDVGVFLLWRDCSAGITCTLDYSAALLSREHFSCNRGWSKKEATFTKAAPGDEASHSRN